MKVQVSDLELVDELAQALRRCGFSVVRTDTDSLQVSPGPAQGGVAEIEGAMELELDVYLKVWQAKHPRAAAVRMD
jgi:hypothetical protein